MTSRSLSLKLLAGALATAGLPLLLEESLRSYLARVPCEPRACLLRAYRHAHHNRLVDCLRACRLARERWPPRDPPPFLKR